MALDAVEVNNNYATINTHDDVVINVSYALDNTQDAIMARETSTFKSKTINNNSGNIMAQDALDINASHRVNYSYNNPTNEYGVFSGGGTNLNLSSTLNNDHSRIVSNGNINITPGYWHSQ